MKHLLVDLKDVVKEGESQTVVMGYVVVLCVIRKKV